MVSRTVSRRSSNSRKYSSFSWIVADLDFVQIAGDFLAVARNERHGCALVEQLDGCRQTLETNAKLLRNMEEYGSG